MSSNAKVKLKRQRRIRNIIWLLILKFGLDWLTVTVPADAHIANELSLRGPEGYISAPFWDIETRLSEYQLFKEVSAIAAAQEAESQRHLTQRQPFILTNRTLVTSIERESNLSEEKDLYASAGSRIFPKEDAKLKKDRYSPDKYKTRENIAILGDEEMDIAFHGLRAGWVSRMDDGTYVVCTNNQVFFVVGGYKKISANLLNVKYRPHLNSLRSMNEDGNVFSAPNTTFSIEILQSPSGEDARLIAHPIISNEKERKSFKETYTNSFVTSEAMLEANQTSSDIFIPTVSARDLLRVLANGKEPDQFVVFGRNKGFRLLTVSPNMTESAEAFINELNNKSTEKGFDGISDSPISDVMVAKPAEEQKKKVGKNISDEVPIDWGKAGKTLLGLPAAPILLISKLINKWKQKKQAPKPKTSFVKGVVMKTHITKKGDYKVELGFKGAHRLSKSKDISDIKKEDLLSKKDNVKRSNNYNAVARRRVSMLISDGPDAAKHLRGVMVENAEEQITTRFFDAPEDASRYEENFRFEHDKDRLKKILKANEAELADAMKKLYVIIAYLNNFIPENKRITSIVITGDRATGIPSKSRTLYIKADDIISFRDDIWIYGLKHAAVHEILHLVEDNLDRDIIPIFRDLYVEMAQYKELFDPCGHKYSNGGYAMYAFFEMFCEYGASLIADTEGYLDWIEILGKSSNPKAQELAVKFWVAFTRFAIPGWVPTEDGTDPFESISIDFLKDTAESVKDSYAPFAKLYLSNSFSGEPAENALDIAVEHIFRYFPEELIEGFKETFPYFMTTEKYAYNMRRAVNLLLGIDYAYETNAVENIYPELAKAAADIVINYKDKPETMEAFKIFKGTKFADFLYNNLSTFLLGQKTERIKTDRKNFHGTATRQDFILRDQNTGEVTGYEVYFEHGGNHKTITYDRHGNVTEKPRLDVQSLAGDMILLGYLELDGSYPIIVELVDRKTYNSAVRLDYVKLSKKTGEVFGYMVEVQDMEESAIFLYDAKAQFSSSELTGGYSEDMIALGYKELADHNNNYQQPSVKVKIPLINKQGLLLVIDSIGGENNYALGKTLSNKKVIESIVPSTPIITTRSIDPSGLISLPKINVLDLINNLSNAKAFINIAEYKYSTGAKISEIKLTSGGSVNVKEARSSTKDKKRFIIEVPITQLVSREQTTRTFARTYAELWGGEYVMSEGFRRIVDSDLESGRGGIFLLGGNVDVLGKPNYEEIFTTIFTSYTLNADKFANLAVVNGTLVNYWVDIRDNFMKDDSLSESRVFTRDGSDLLSSQKGFDEPPKINAEEMLRPYIIGEKTMSKRELQRLSYYINTNYEGLSDAFFGYLTDKTNPSAMYKAVNILLNLFGLDHEGDYTEKFYQAVFSTIAYIERNPDFKYTVGNASNIVKGGRFVDFVKGKLYKGSRDEVSDAFLAYAKLVTPDEFFKYGLNMACMTFPELWIKPRFPYILNNLKLRTSVREKLLKDEKVEHFPEDISILYSWSIGDATGRVYNMPLINNRLGRIDFGIERHKEDNYIGGNFMGVDKVSLYTMKIIPKLPYYNPSLEGLRVGTKFGIGTYDFGDDSQEDSPVITWVPLSMSMGHSIFSLGLFEVGFNVTADWWCFYKFLGSDKGLYFDNMGLKGKRKPMNAGPSFRAGITIGLKTPKASKSRKSSRPDSAIQNISERKTNHSILQVGL